MQKRKGFTLVELLIVIIIIGILAAAMMMSSTSATASARASNVISELRSLKAAAIMWRADHIGLDGTSTPPTKIDDLGAYMDHPDSFSSTSTQPSPYDFVGADDSVAWFVTYKVTEQAIADKLEARNSIGLYAAGTTTLAAPTKASGKTEYTKYTAGTTSTSTPSYVAMLVKE